MVIVANLSHTGSFFTLAFASFVEAQNNFDMSFSDWLKVLIFSRRTFRVANGCWFVGKDGNLQVSHRGSLCFCSAHFHEILAKSCFFVDHMARA
jgi:hypothetical protein